MALAKRQRRTPLFLHRTTVLRRSAAAATKAKANAKAPTVRYVSAHKSLSWRQDACGAACIFCTVTFGGADDLLAHLRASHGRFDYSLVPADGGAISVEVRPLFTSSLPYFPRCASDLILQVTLSPDRSCGNDERFVAWDCEAVYAKSGQFVPKAIEGAAWTTVRYVVGDDGRKRRRMALGVVWPKGREENMKSLYALSKARLVAEVSARGSVEVRDFISSFQLGDRDEGVVAGEDGESGDPVSGSTGGGSSSQGSALESCGEKGMKRGKGSPVFNSFEDGVQGGILYRSVLQSKPQVEDFEDGMDSDAMDGAIDEDWRLEVNDKQLEAFEDNSPQETCYMNLWNQFVLVEAFVHSDRRHLCVMNAFATKYGAVLFHMKLQVILVRHLKELHRRGLIDATGMHEVVLSAGQARLEAAKNSTTVARLMAGFAFSNRV